MNPFQTVILLAEGFEEIEALAVVDVLRRLGIGCAMCSTGALVVKGAHGIVVTADATFDEVNFDACEMVILPGGMPGTANLRADRRVVSIVRQFDQAKKRISAICAAPIVLKEAGIAAGRTLTSFPGYRNEFAGSRYAEDRVVRDGNLITSRGPGTALEFAFAIAETLTDKAAVDRLRQSMQTA